MKTKVITAIGVGALALSLGQSSVNAQEKGTVTASALNIRSGPGLENSVKGCLYKGDTVVVLEKSNGWLKVQVSNKTTGWVSEKYIEIGNDSTSTIYVKVKCSARLNVRSGPGTTYKIKTAVESGTVHKVLEKSKDWYKIQLSNGISGWVYSSYVEETVEGVSSESTNESTKPNEDDDNNNNNNNNIDIVETEVNLNGKVTSSANLNVRSGPGTNYSIKGSLSSGKVVFLLSESNGWYKVKLSSGEIGWVSSSYISKTNTYGKATGNLNVRSGPGTSYSIKTVLISGEVVTINKSSNSWYEIKTSSNITGWVSSKYINITSELPNDNTNTSGDTNNNTNNDNANNNNSTNESRYEELINFAMTQLGKPYVWGGNGPNSFDCSGFTRYVYLNAIGVSLPRVSYDQAKAGTAVDINNLQKGDLLYFATITPGRTSHVGIYIGDNQFIHASGSQTRPDKVKISSLSGYYGNVLLGARRF